MSIKLYSFNVNGIRAIGKKGFWEWMESEKPDILAIQEIKADDEIMRALKSGHPKIELTLLDNQIKDPSINSSKTHKPQLLDSGASFDINLDQITTNPSLIDDKSENNNLNYNIFWHACSMKKGYSGTAIFYKPHLFKEVEIFTGLGDSKFDVEGRITGFKTEYFTLINGYYPQGGREGRVSYKLEFYQKLHDLVSDLEAKGEKVILTGDFNTTLGDIDLARPKENKKTTGCLPEERVAFSWILNPNHFEVEKLIITDPNLLYLNQETQPSLNFIDAFRYFHPNLPDQYTYWDQITRARDRNVGWRIDYFNVSPKLEKNMVSSNILNQVMGSDHCPIVLELKF